MDWVEFVQWVVIALLAFFLLGAYRQLGFGIGGREDTLESLSGVPEGQLAPSSLLGEIELPSVD